MNQARNWRKGLGVMLAAVAGVLAFAPPAQSSNVIDSFSIGGGSTNKAGGACAFTATNELMQVANLGCFAPTAGITPGIVVLLEAPGEPLGETSVVTNVDVLDGLARLAALNVGVTIDRTR